MSPDMIISRVSFGLAGTDLVVATVCAIYGDAWFAPFMILAGLMYMQGLYYKAKSEGE